MGNEPRIGLPGVGTSRTTTPRRLLLGDMLASYKPAGFTLDGSESRDPLNTGDLATLRTGLLLGKIEATGLYAPMIVGVLTAAYTSGGVSLTVSAATATELDRRLGGDGAGTFTVIGPPNSGAAVAEITATASAVSGTTVTVSSLGVNMINGSLICMDDESWQPVGILDAGNGVKVTDVDGNNIDVSHGKLLIAGYVDTGQVINMPSDLSLRQYIVDELHKRCGSLYWSHMFDATETLNVAATPTPTPPPTPTPTPTPT